MIPRRPGPVKGPILASDTKPWPGASAVQCQNCFNICYERAADIRSIWAKGGCVLCGPCASHLPDLIPQATGIRIGFVDGNGKPCAPPDGADARAIQRVFNKIFEAKRN